jgi:hypothetical protein
MNPVTITEQEPLSRTELQAIARQVRATLTWAARSACGR